MRHTGHELNDAESTYVRALEYLQYCFERDYELFLISDQSAHKEEDEEVLISSSFYSHNYVEIGGQRYGAGRRS